jgi:hypothetical protein
MPIGYYFYFKVIGSVSIHFSDFKNTNIGCCKLFYMSLLLPHSYITP